VDHEHVHIARVREGNEPALENDRTMPDRILTATAVDGSFSVVAGITTELVRETQRRLELAPTASAAVGRLLTGAALLGASLKGREKLTLQIAGDGPLKGIVADVALNDAHEIGARGYARRPDVDVPLNARGKFDVGGAVGRGYLQVTRSFEVGQPYVGITELQSGEIGDDIAAYLMTSEQIPSVVALGVLANPAGIKASGGVIAQVLPGAAEATIATLEARALSMAPVTTQIDGGASPADLVAALAGSLDVRITREYALAYTCTCSRDRVERALLGLGRDELEKILREQDRTEAICEFCKTAYVLSRDEVNGLIARLEARS
jgi:molecular chaperone Hsp33